MYVYDALMDANFDNFYIYGGGTMSLNTPYSLIMNYTGGNLSPNNPTNPLFYLNGAVQTPLNGTSNNAPSLNLVSNSVGGSNSGDWMQGYICELVVYNVGLTALQTAQLITYFQTKWGV